MRQLSKRGNAIAEPSLFEDLVVLNLEDS
jgi:hypothetical protein